mmetsp:Transcript_17585/g.31809  ORF Transcript_17585/g.31809 Transcript_17585/m.31809 type:complete len:241 (+) Transcript_17585:75-797(+)|eukprot:CAMPEP_0201639756 /NCGR_PEP_ID=MMETSP0493-20130528/20277_1 /ASSEMBLY_ACC=CAM_ASM_000838 /TAXON_ID=420259 /ORGANISM="Thalassiosira gravida, Strain GMp14c1" /LENGTH=240 /DNA_ID=CAMNT_0048113253 /DNA_START=33 /DNA_END=755 /DNA_ORIENTATION=+
MHLQLLPLAVFASVSADIASRDLFTDDDRSLQVDSAACLASGDPPEQCCPCAKPDDGICTLLWCVDIENVNVNDGCVCSQIDTACVQLKTLGLVLAMVPGVTELCAKAGECCVDGMAINGDFNACMKAALDASEIQVPDLSLIVPAALPDWAAIGSPDCPEQEAVADDASAEPSSETTEADGATEEKAVDVAADTTETPADSGSTPDGSQSPDDGLNHANKYDISTLMTLVGSSLVALFV